MTWPLFLAIFAIPTIITAALQYAYRGRGGITAGWGVAIFVLTCWIVALIVLQQKLKL